MCIICNVSIGDDVSAIQRNVEAASKFRMRRTMFLCTASYRSREWNKLEEKREHQAPTISGASVPGVWWEISHRGWPYATDEDKIPKGVRTGRLRAALEREEAARAAASECQREVE